MPGSSLVSRIDIHAAAALHQRFATRGSRLPLGVIWPLRSYLAHRHERFMHHHTENNTQARKEERLPQIKRYREKEREREGKKNIGDDEIERKRTQYQKRRRR